MSARRRVESPPEPATRARTPRRYCQCSPESRDSAGTPRYSRGQPRPEPSSGEEAARSASDRAGEAAASVAPLPRPRRRSAPHPPAGRAPAHQGAAEHSAAEHRAAAPAKPRSPVAAEPAGAAVGPGPAHGDPAAAAALAAGSLPATQEHGAGALSEHGFRQHRHR